MAYYQGIFIEPSIRARQWATFGVGEDYRVVWTWHPGNEFELEHQTAALETWDPEERRWVYLRKATFSWQAIAGRWVDCWQVSQALHEEQREADTARSIGAPSLIEAANPAGFRISQGEE